MGITEYAAQIEELTALNLKLLKTINDSFYTDKTHLTVKLDEGQFVIPSFVSLENKLNALQDNFENLVNAPKTSEAHFTFDGNSRAIEVKGYEQSPLPLIMKPADGQTSVNFYHKDNNIFKDFLTPIPYLKFDATSLPNDINKVIFRKVIPVSDMARTRFYDLYNQTSSYWDNTRTVPWGDVYKAISDLNEGTDYILYDTTQTLPVRKGSGTGLYVIQEIVEDTIDQNLDQHIVFKFLGSDSSYYYQNLPNYHNTLTYTLFDQTIETPLQVGDYLVSGDGTVKFQIEELNFNNNTVKVRVMFGDFATLAAWDENTQYFDPNDMPEETQIIKFFSDPDQYDEGRYISIPLEEDDLIYVTIAPLNERMNIRAPWCDGLMVDVWELVDSDNVNFKDYYKNCRNVGDILNEISKVMGNTTSSHTNEELNILQSAVPVIDQDIIKVTHINKHLDESTTMKNIRALYSQKNKYNADLTETQARLTELQNKLLEVDFQDTTGIRVTLQAQIDEATTHKNDLINSLIKITNEISLTANNSVVPIENAKYRIRGFFDYEEFINQLVLPDSDLFNISEKNVKGIHVEYRYRNVQQEVGTAQSFAKDDKTFIFSDWNLLYTPLRPRIKNGDEYEAEPDNSNINVPSFNQIDIPITQGERVDVRLKVIYDLGYPFIQMTSDWSDVVTFEFPEEFMKDVQILDIIEENNNDIETNRFKSILVDQGVPEHVADKIIDQDVTYFHKPESISSGFYTSERRIIPLRDKLASMNNDIIRILDEIEGTNSESIGVNIDFDESSVELSPYQIGTVVLADYSLYNTPGQHGNYVCSNDGLLSVACNIRLTNKSDRTVKIFSMFPASENTTITSTAPRSKFTNSEFTGIYYYGVLQGSTSKGFTAQTSNQFLTFRNCNPYDGTTYYTGGPVFGTDNLLSNENGYFTLQGQAGTTMGMAAYPSLYKDKGLLMTYKEAYSYMLLNPGDELVVPLMVEYRLQQTGKTHIEKTIAFDIRTSLYNDPLTYSFKVSAEYESSPQDKIVGSLTNKYQSQRVKEYNPIVS